MSSKRTKLKSAVKATNGFFKNCRLISRHEGRVTLEFEEKQLQSQLASLQQFFGGVQEVLLGGPKSDHVDPIEVLQEEQSQSSPDENSLNQQKDSVDNRDGKEKENEVKETQDFYRRIPHFFMGRFKKWAKILQENEVYEFLNKIKEGKKSKQGRYELGDFHKCFQIEKSDSNEDQKCKKKIKELFLEFLQNEAVLQIIQYNKITKQEQKTKYIDVIPNMVQEMYSDKPFHEFLAQQNIEKAIKKKNQFEQEDIPKVELFRGESFKFDQ